MRRWSAAVTPVPPSTACPGDRWPSTGSGPPPPPSSAWCGAPPRAPRTCGTRRTCTGRRPARWWAGWPSSPPSPLHHRRRPFYSAGLCHSAACRWSSPVRLQGAAKDKVRSGSMLLLQTCWLWNTTNSFHTNPKECKTYSQFDCFMYIS